jgi:hypothetical protein
MYGSGQAIMIVNWESNNIVQGTLVFENKCGGFDNKMGFLKIKCGAFENIYWLTPGSRSLNFRIQPFSFEIEPFPGKIQPLS